MVRNRHDGGAARRGLSMGRPPHIRKEAVYTLQVGGIPTLSFSARSHAEASSLRNETWFRDDLRSARSSGKLLWDGEAPLMVRAATLDEAARYQEAANAIIDGSDDLFLAYLVELDR
jgi:hypothetical protein